MEGLIDITHIVNTLLSGQPIGNKPIVIHKDENNATHYECEIPIVCLNNRIYNI